MMTNEERYQHEFAILLGGASEVLTDEEEAIEQARLDDIPSERALRGC